MRACMHRALRSLQKMATPPRNFEQSRNADEKISPSLTFVTYNVLAQKYIEYGSVLLCTNMPVRVTMHQHLLQPSKLCCSTERTSIALHSKGHGRVVGSVLARSCCIMMQISCVCKRSDLTRAISEVSAFVHTC